MGEIDLLGLLITSSELDELLIGASGLDGLLITASPCERSERMSYTGSWISSASKISAHLMAIRALQTL
jgi:hypothetical protein